MDKCGSFSSQESLPLSQESFNYLWTQLKSQGIKPVIDDASQDTAVLNAFTDNDNPTDTENGDLEITEEAVEYGHNDAVNIATPTPTSSSADSKSYTHLNIPTTVLPTALHSEYTTVEFYPEDTTTSRVNRNNIPPNTDWPGDYGFHITFQAEEKTTKSSAWTYSDIKEKLFVNMAVACPVNVHVKTRPPPGSVIRAMTIFSRPEHITDIVRRCLNHSSSADPMNEGHPAPNHLVRCDNPSSKYVEDYSTRRQSVVTEYEHPQIGMEYSTYLYRFMCLGSCVGGLNRRPLQLIFTLEKDGHCLGRKVMGLRICACPGRDKRTEEKQLEKPGASKRNTHLKTSLDIISGPPLKKQKSSSGDEDSAYTVTVYRRSHYEIVKKMVDALELAELASLLTPEESSALQQRYMRCKKKKFHQSKESQHSSEESSA